MNACILSAAASDFADGESWGYRKFYELSRLVRGACPRHLLHFDLLHVMVCVTAGGIVCFVTPLQEEDNFLKDNTLVLKFSVRAPNYHQKCKDLTL